VTVLALTRLHRPADFADWYRIGAEYVLEVAERMGFDVGEAPERVAAATEAMRAGRTDLPPALARSVAADLYADATFCEPFVEWTPLWYELALLGPVRYAEWRLRRVAGAYAADLDHVTVPTFSRPRDVLVGGRPAVEAVSGFRDRFVFADALLHLEWFVHVARESGVTVPPALVEQTREETVAYYAGRRPSLSPEVRRFQALLFTDDRWVRRIDEAYGLDSTLFGVWEGLLADERRALERAADDAG
jgi:hypothetical protein